MIVELRLRVGGRIHALISLEILCASRLIVWLPCFRVTTLVISHRFFQVVALIVWSIATILGCLIVLTTILLVHVVGAVRMMVVGLVTTSLSRRVEHLGILVLMLLTIWLVPRLLMLVLLLMVLVLLALGASH